MAMVSKDTLSRILSDAGTNWSVTRIWGSVQKWRYCTRSRDLTAQYMYSFDRAPLYDCCDNSIAVQQVCVLSVVWSVFGFTGEVYMIQSCDKKSLFNLSICFCRLHVFFKAPVVSCAIQFSDYAVCTLVILVIFTHIQDLMLAYVT